MGRVRVKLAIKLLITGLLLWVAFAAVDLARVSSLLSALDPLWAAAAVFLTFMIIVADGLLLATVLPMFDRRVPLRIAMRYSLVGWFFSNLAPSTVGGDVFRGVQLARAGTSAGTAFRAVLAIRLLSLATLAAVMVAGLPIASRIIGDRIGYLLILVTLVSAIAALVAVYFFDRIPMRLRLFERWRLAERLKTISTDFRRLVTWSPQAVIAWVESAVQHVLRVGVLAALAMGLGLGIPVEALFALTPAALLLAMVPISFGGWGVRELSFVYLLGTAGVGATEALALSVAFGLLRLAVGAIGGLAWIVLDDDHFRVTAPPS